MQPSRCWQVLTDPCDWQMLAALLWLQEAGKEWTRQPCLEGSSQG